VERSKKPNGAWLQPELIEVADDNDHTASRPPGFPIPATGAGGFRTMLAVTFTVCVQLLCRLQHVETPRCDAMQTRVLVSVWLREHPAFDLLVDPDHPLQCGRRQTET